MNVEGRKWPLAIDHPKGALRSRRGARVADLATLLAVERGFMTDDSHGTLVGGRQAGHFLALGHDGHDLALAGRRFITEKLRRADPVEDALEHALHCQFARAHEFGSAALFGHAHLESGLVDGESIASGNYAGQVKGKAVGVVEPKGDLAGNHAIRTLAHLFVEHAHATSQHVAEAVLLLTRDGLDDAAAITQLGVDFPHHVHDKTRELREVAVAAQSEQPAVVDGASHDPAQNVFAAGFFGEHTVGDEERGGARVVRDGTHGNRD